MIEDKNKIAIILPAYNEELTIQKTIESFVEVIPYAQIVVVNNNSSDDTEKIAHETIDKIKANGIVLNELKQGKGHAIRRAFNEIDADIYVMCDADQTYPADKIFDLLEPIKNKTADMVIGDRHSLGDYRSTNKRKFHDFGNQLVKILINKLFKSKLNDIMTGYRAFSKRFVKNYPILIAGFELETDMTLHALDKRFHILEIPISYHYRPEGSASKLNTFRDGAKVLFVILQLLRYYKPLVFFGSLSLLFTLGSIIASIPVFEDWFKHQYIYHVPLAILASALAIVSVLTMGIGLLLDSINHQNKMGFEQSIIYSKE